MLIYPMGDPVDFFEASLSSSLIPGPGETVANTANEARWRDQGIDDALANYRADDSAAAKAEILRKLRDEIPLLPLMYGPTIIVHSWAVEGFKPPAFGAPNLAGLRMESSS